jgi:hypothetical protein
MKGRIPMSLTTSPSDARKPDTIGGLLELLSRYGVKVYLRNGRLKVTRPFPTWEEAPGPVRYALRWLKARRQELKAYLREQQERELLDSLYGWTLPVSEEEEQRRVRQVFDQNENIPVPVTPKRTTWLDRWPPLPELISRLEAAGFTLELDVKLLRVIPPAPVEELPADLLALYNQAEIRRKAIALHLRGRNDRENAPVVRPPEGVGALNYCFNPETGKWEHRPGWWRWLH